MKRVKRDFVIAGAMLAAFAALPACAQPDAPPNAPASPMAARLSAERVSDVQPGLYSVGDGSDFILKSYGSRYLLQFADAPENFVLTVDRGSLGTKLLKYDTGATALRVSVWGGITLYTQAAPGGLPATRQDDTPSASQGAIQGANVSLSDLQTAFGDEAVHLAYAQNIALRFSADPSVLAADAETHGRAFDALTNATLGIEHFLAAAPGARAVLTRRIKDVKITEGARPTLMISGQTLLVSFAPDEGHEGHASSLAITQALCKLLPGSAKDVAVK
jgi:hypothetical protein